MWNALIVVWRESLEAMLVIGVLLSWIARQPAPAPLRRGLWSGVAAGFALAAATAGIVARGAKFLNLRTLFRVSEFLLLVIATSLLVAGIDRMIGMEWLPPLADPLWDASGILSDAGGAGRFLADFTGYRAQPAATVVIAVLAFWSYALWRMKRIDRAGVAA